MIRIHDQSIHSLNLSTTSCANRTIQNFLFCSTYSPFVHTDSVLLETLILAVHIMPLGCPFDLQQFVFCSSIPVHFDFLPRDDTSPHVWIVIIRTAAI